MFGLTPHATEASQDTAGPLRWQKEPKCQKTDRRRGVGEEKGEEGVDPRDPGVGGTCRGGEGRSESVCASFNLIGVQPCRGAGEPCREATVIAQIIHWWEEKTDLGKYMDMWGECRWFETEEGRRRKEASWGALKTWRLESCTGKWARYTSVA